MQDDHLAILCDPFVTEGQRYAFQQLLARLDEAVRTERQVEVERLQAAVRAFCVELREYVTALGDWEADGGR